MKILKFTFLLRTWTARRRTVLHQPKLKRVDNYFSSREGFRGREFSFLTMFWLASPLSGRKIPSVTIRKTKTVRSIQLKLKKESLPATLFVSVLTQAHCPVCRLLETFWTFTSLVVLWHLESIWTLTIVTSWTIDTQMAAVVFNILIAFIDIWETPNWNTVKPLLGGPPIKRTPSIKRTL